MIQTIDTLLYQVLILVKGKFYLCKVYVHDIHCLWIRVWIRLNPTDTGKALAQRIHVVATYKSRKILSIKTTSGRVIPLDDTPVFDDWNEIANLEDGAPWEVEWGQKDDPFSGGRELFKSIKASLLAGKD